MPIKPILIFGYNSIIFFINYCTCQKLKFLKLSEFAEYKNKWKNKKTKGKNSQKRMKSGIKRHEKRKKLCRTKIFFKARKKWKNCLKELSVWLKKCLEIQYDIGHLHKLSENKVEKVAGFSSVRDRIQGVRPPHGPAQQTVQGEPTSTHSYCILSPNF